jgi:hypothetical protein
MDFKRFDSSEETCHSVECFLNPFVPNFRLDKTRERHSDGVDARIQVVLSYPRSNGSWGTMKYRLIVS